jgi:hypothetical protein
MADTTVVGKRPRTLKGHVLFQILTKAIYTTFTRAIKEAVSNAYDAGANNVEITFDPPTFLNDQEPSELTIQIRDDGKGMSLEDFWEKFASIDSEKDPTKKDPTTGRFPIGKFGIGSFALVPFSLGLTIFSRKFNETPIRCVIHTDKLMEKTSDDFPDHVSKSINDQKITHEEWETVFGSKDSGTVIVVQGVTKETYSELVAGIGRFEDGGRNIFPGAPFTMGLKEIAWELSTLLPLHYADDPGGIAKAHKSSLKSNNKGIHITLSEVELHRQIYSRPHSAIKTIDYDNDGIKARGVIVAIPHGAVQPRQANGVILRLNNVGIGNYSLLGLVGNEGIRRRITGEIHIVQGLHNALNAARDRFSGAEFDQLQTYLHKALVDLSRHAYSGWEDKQDRKEEATEKTFEQRHKQTYERKQREVPNPTTPPSAKPAAPDTPRKPGADGGGKAEPRKPDPQTQVKDAGGRSTADAPQDNGAFSDPVIDVRHSTGTMRFNEGHDLFKKFKGKAEKRTLKIVLRALHLAAVPQDMYQRIIDSLLSLK